MLNVSPRRVLVPSRGNTKPAALSVGVLFAVCLAVCFTPVAARPESVPNPQFDQGSDAPTGWTLSGGEGRWVDRQVLEVTGSGAQNESNYWRCDGYEFKPGALYHFQVQARGAASGGCVVSGPSFANRDYHTTPNEWKWYGHVFRAPENTEGAYLRLGQWQAKGTVEFNAVRVVPSLPVHRVVAAKLLGGPVLLGEGETVRDGLYEFLGTFGHAGSNFHRTLASATAGFNSDRWTFGPNSQITYRFDLELPLCQFVSGGVAFNVNYHTRGSCVAEISRDQNDWRPLAMQNGLGTAEAELPGALLPARALFLRLRAADDSSFQVNRVEFRAKLSGRSPLGGSLPDLSGGTAFADVVKTCPSVSIERMAMSDPALTGAPWLHLLAKNVGDHPIILEAAISQGDAGTGDRWSPAPGPKRSVGPGESAGFDLPVPISKPGDQEVHLRVGQLRTPEGFVQANLHFYVPDLYRTDYGERIAGVSGDTGVWWCSAGHKIPRRRSAPAQASAAASISACRHDYEAVQIVVRPATPLNRLTAKPAPLVGPDGATIPAENLQILRVYYHLVDHPTDRTGVRDWWPDALPPLDAPLDVSVGENQPLWLRVHVPENAKPGDYRGEIRMEAEGWSATAPIKLHVWDFTLPKRNHIDTAFGFSAGNVFRYHRLKTEEDKRRVLDMYLRCFSEHRISPYDPAPLDSIGVKFLPQADPPRAELDFAAFDRAMTRAVEEFHFTGFRLPIHGMGGGTFHARYEPKIEGFGEKTPEYQAMFSSYVKQLEEHFREKGWLDMPYIYWFDEPDPKDYEFVRNGFERLKKYAAGLRTMLTEQPEEALAGPVDIWCPVSPNYDYEAAEKRRAHGDVFWWYVCTGPKAPYCTLFIDHPATELRVWLWQTWERRIVGTLVWQSNYWTSSAAFPDEPQNPYEDPMGYVSGYSTPRGVKRFWGNGDGRFVYPPLAAAAPGISGPDPVIEPPVSSIRWEMLREGIEDYEYLYLLRELLAKRRDGLSAEEIKKYEALLEVPESITKDMTTFTTDPAPIYARRAEIAEAIERLSK